MSLPIRMKAALCTAYGAPEVIRLGEGPTPKLGADGVLIRVHATTVSSGDWRVRSLKLPPGFGPLGRLIFGFQRPRQPILGTDCAGVVVEVGPEVQDFRVGDRVVAFPDFRMGCHAQYVGISAKGMIAPVPEGLGFEEGTALCFGGLTALHFLNKADVKKGDSVLVLGGSGSVGSMLVQLARFRGAHVTATCSEANRELVSGLGAEEVLDYRKGNVFSGGEKYDAVMDTTGTVSRSEALAALKPEGRAVLLVAGLSDVLRSVFLGGRVIASPASSTPEGLRELIRLAELGSVKSVVERVYEYGEIVEAHRHVETGRKRGNVVVRWA
ncbi:MAG: NAD(P)-dependent alcohol dehydrogenase [Candidatus Sumerlaeia bacterium]|nr:NAD(P)-dependent alcohol dehydrogenase [Candidatus Sumerlaeia bacterium]